jgi:hypothetical protein
MHGGLMDRRRFLGWAAVCVAAPSFACQQAGATRGRDEIAITVHKDPG